MLPASIAIIAIVALVVLWVISTHRRLAILDEHIGSAMNQLGLQLSCRFDCLMSLLELIKGYSQYESEALIKTVSFRRSAISAKAMPVDVLRQEALISEALGWIKMITKEYPELRANPDYIKAMDAIETFDGMVRTSRLIYNDSVARLNREIRSFPVSLVAEMFGFRQREYLELKGVADL
jgi:LemA protein